MDKSAVGVIVVVAVLVLFAGVGSVIPEGGVTLAMFVIVPLAPAVPVTVKVTLPPLGKVGMVTAPDCKLVTVRLAVEGHVAEPVTDEQLTPVAVKFGTLGSLTVELFAVPEPLFVITKV